MLLYVCLLCSLYLIIVLKNYFRLSMKRIGDFGKEFHSAIAWFSNPKCYTSFYYFITKEESNFSVANKTNYIHAMKVLTSLVAEEAELISEKSSLVFAKQFWEKKARNINCQKEAENRKKKTTLFLKGKNQFLSRNDWKKIGSKVMEE